MYWGNQEDAYAATVAKVRRIMDAREAKYAAADLHIPLENSPAEAGDVGAPPAVVAYRCVPWMRMQDIPLRILRATKGFSILPCPGAVAERALRVKPETDAVRRMRCCSFVSVLQSPGALCVQSISGAGKGL